MNVFFQVLLGGYTLALTTVIGYDMITALSERYSHFHMGQWKSREEWKKAVAKVCRRWAKKTPVLRLKKECRYLLTDRLRGRYGKTMVQSWQKAGCLLGLEMAGQADELYPTIKKQLLAENGSWKEKPKKIDYAMLAYALLRGEDHPESVRPAMEEMVTCIEANQCGDNLISYSGGKSAKRRYVDTLGFICPFLGLYGKVFHKPEYIDMAVSQISLFREKGVFQGLPVHCYNAENGMPIGIHGWGRGTGWYVLALTELYPCIEKREQKDLLEGWMRETAEAVLSLALKQGGFSSILAAEAPYDSSATAMLGYFLARCGKSFQEKRYIEAAVECERRLMRATKIYGAVDGCQGDTIDIGIFSERYAEMPFAQGMTLCLAESLDR